MTSLFASGIRIHSKKSAFSALQLNDDIHLSLSATNSPTPPTAAADQVDNAFFDDNVFEDIDLNSSGKPSHMSEGKLKVTYRDAVKSAPGPVRSSSWYDGFLGCLKPVMGFISKGKSFQNC